MNCLVLSILSVLFTLLYANGNNTSQNISLESKVEKTAVLEKWSKIEDGAKKLMNSTINLLLPYVIQHLEKANISSKCKDEVFHLIGGLENIKTWAFRFLDSSAKSIDGLLYGSFSSFGDYDECIDTVVKSEELRDNGKVLYKGQYCILKIAPPLPPKKRFYKVNEVMDEFKEFSKGGNFINELAKNAQMFSMTSSNIGICVPSGCNLNDLEKVAKLLSVFTEFDVIATRCEVKTEYKVSPVHIFVVITYSFLILLMIIGTSVDLLKDHYKLTCNYPGIMFFLAFSVVKNFKDFSKVETSFHLFSCLPGIRFFSMGYVIIRHTYFLFNYETIMDLTNFKTFLADFAFQIIANATVAIDTFFFMSSILVSYLTLKKMKNNGNRFSIMRHFTHRLWRILPAYIGVILFVLLENLIGSGPTGNSVRDWYFQSCREKWWINVLFVNNFFHAGETCMLHTWYIACDIQLYVAFTFIIILISRCPKFGLSLCVSTIFSTLCYNGIAMYFLDYIPTNLLQQPGLAQLGKFIPFFYLWPFPHMSTYAIGVIAGYILLEKPNIKIPKVWLVLGWCSAIILNSSVLFGRLSWNRGVDPTPWVGILYITFDRTAWSLGIAWMIVCCVTGYGGVINYILSLKVFIPLGRLTFLAYLIHPLVIFLAVGNIRSKVPMQHAAMVYMFFGHLCITFSLAFLAYMLIESPISKLENIFFSSNRQKNADKEKRLSNEKQTSG